MEQWDQDFIDLVELGFISFQKGGRGDMRFGAVSLELDWDIIETAKTEFTFTGSNRSTICFDLQMKPANLNALAEHGIDGEKISAQKKLVRLKALFDFSEPDRAETPDLFSGSFKRSTTARRIYSFGPHECDVANSVKWAIESATGIACVHRDNDLLAEAAPRTANRLTEIANHIAHSFRALLDKFSAIDGVSVTDRAVFVMGLYDGMMNDVRTVGQRLPDRSRVPKKLKAKKRAVSCGTGLHIHPYTVAVSLGKQIRFSAPLEQITAELESVTQKHLTQ